MNENLEADQLRAELEELSFLLENRTFVDYFNTFLCLPVFGQHVFYNYMDREFDFEPPLRNRRHLFIDRRELLKWLCTDRLRPFKMSALYTEYNLCILLRDTSVDLPGIKDVESSKYFTRNVIGNATGMILFRESMRGTSGENVYRCWKDIQAWKLITDPVRKMYWRHVINTHYISQNSITEVPGKINARALNGLLNFDLVPDEDIYNLIFDTVLKNLPYSFVASDETLLMLQKALYIALTKYWLPRHLLHVLNTISKETLEILCKPAPGDVEYLGYERRLRCHLMFPTIGQNSSIVSPASSVYVSKSAEDLPGMKADTPSASSSDGDVITMVEEARIDPVDLLSLCGGPAKEIELERNSISSFSSSLSINESPDDFNNRKLRSANVQTRLRSPVPIVLTSYLGGKKRTLLGRFPKTTSRIIWSLASDALACNPLREYLRENGQTFDMKYLNFWTDVRNYLDTDENVMDGYGQPLRRLLAHKIANAYLSHNGEECDIFSETLKMSLFTAISTSNDVSLLCMAQDIIQESLWEPLKLYIQDDRRRFLKQVRGWRYQLDTKQRQAVDFAARTSRLKQANDMAAVDPLYFFNCVTIEAGSPSPPTSPVCTPTAGCLSSMSRPETSYHVCITEEQMWKAMEVAVLCSEYGVSMMLPQYLPRAEQLVDVLHSDYGSLHVDRAPAVRHEWLKHLLKKPKINIETIKVSREVFLDKVDIASIKSKEAEKETEHVPRGRCRMVRRHGLIIERPIKPKSLMEVLSASTQFDFFKRFMLVNKMSLPVMFWRAVEDLKELSNSKTRQIRVTQIVRKFFGKYAKYGASLDCHEEIIRQIPNMDKVTPGILICAQAAVFRSLERKWFPQYLETFPPESGATSPNTISFSVQTGVVRAFDDVADFVQTTKRAKKKTLGIRKTLFLWKSLSKSLVNFCKAIGGKSESQLMEMFLKYEVEREKLSPQKDQMASQLQHVEKNMMMSNVATNVQTRVVIRNRLIIMNRLPADMKFWIEVKKFQDLVDSAIQKGNVSNLDTEFLCDKARSIISCFLASDIMPKVQVNIPNDMATNIINSLASVGPSRGLFHDAIVLIFPILFHYYRKFSEDWMKGNIPDEYFESIEHVLQDRVATTPHNQEPCPNFKNIKPEQFKTTTQVSLDESIMRIHFSLSEGATLIYPQVKVHANKSTTGPGRRMTKHSIHVLNDDGSPRKESAMGHGDKKDGKRAQKAGDKSIKPEENARHSPKNIKERKMSERIIVKESDHPTRSSPDQTRRQSTDKARRLSILVETLNKEKEVKIKEQNRKFSKLMSFDEVVTAAMAEFSDTNSMFS